MIARNFVSKIGRQESEVRKGSIRVEAEVGVMGLLAMKMEEGHEPRNVGSL